MPNQPPVSQSGASLAGSYESYFGVRLPVRRPTVEERAAQRQQLRSHLAALCRVYGASDTLDALHSALLDEEKRLTATGHYEDATRVGWMQDDLDGMEDRLEQRESSQEERSDYDD